MTNSAPTLGRPLTAADGRIYIRSRIDALLLEDSAERRSQGG